MVSEETYLINQVWVLISWCFCRLYIRFGPWKICAVLFSILATICVDTLNIWNRYLAMYGQKIHWRHFFQKKSFSKKKGGVGFFASLDLGFEPKPSTLICLWVPNYGHYCSLPPHKITFLAPSKRLLQPGTAVVEVLHHPIAVGSSATAVASRCYSPQRQQGTCCCLWPQQLQRGEIKEKGENLGKSKIKNSKIWRKFHKKSLEHE